MLLSAGLENAEQDALGASPGRGAIASPYFARDQHGRNRWFSAPVGGFQTGTVQKSEQRVALPRQMPRQALMLQRGWEISRHYAIFAMPVAYLIDQKGVIAHDVAVGVDNI